MRVYVPALTALALATPALAEDYPFEGTWDCGVAVFSFTDQIFNTGSENMPITDIVAEGKTFILTFEDDYQLSLQLNGDGTLNWSAPASGEAYTCKAVK